MTTTTLSQDRTLNSRLQPYRYTWPGEDLASLPGWKRTEDGQAFVRPMPESDEELEKDSRWPAMFPSPLCLVTTGDGKTTGLEKVVGASIVNRFPYVVALSFCRKHLSKRHHVRRVFTDLLEANQTVAIQYLPPGAQLDAAFSSIMTVPESESSRRIASTGLRTREAQTNESPVFEDAYMVYEARLVKPSKDFEGRPIYDEPWIDVGSHRVYFLEINAIQLRKDIARGETQIFWRALPAWKPQHSDGTLNSETSRPVSQGNRYEKGYNPEYSFPSPGTVAFEADAEENGMAIKYLPPLPENQVEVDNDRARWPCFFPSSAGMITLWTPDGKPNLMPCGSTTILSRQPLVIAPCVSYAAINVRYAPRASLDYLRRAGRFGCGVPFISPEVVRAIRYAGNVSIKTDPDKVSNSGLAVEAGAAAPILPALPVHFDCRITGEVRLGTHIMFIGEVERIRVRSDVTPSNPLEWYPWADVPPVK